MKEYIKKYPFVFIGSISILLLPYLDVYFRMFINRPYFYCIRVKYFADATQPEIVFKSIGNLTFLAIYLVINLLVIFLIKKISNKEKPIYITTFILCILVITCFLFIFKLQLGWG